MILATVEGQVVEVGYNPNKKDETKPYPYFKVMTQAAGKAELEKIDGNGYKVGDKFHSVVSIQNGDYGLRVKEISKVAGKQ